MTIAEYYNRNLEEDDFIKNNFKTKDEKRVARMLEHYFYFEQEDYYINGELLDDDFKIKDFENELEERKNINILANRFLQGINKDVNYLMNNKDLFNKEKEQYIEIFERYKKEIENDILNSQKIYNLLSPEIQQLAKDVIHNIDNNIAKLQGDEKASATAKRKFKMSM
jgi:hypothetical protein